VCCRIIPSIEPQRTQQQDSRIIGPTASARFLTNLGYGRVAMGIGVLLLLVALLEAP
jgi:hypothetical protein